MRKKHKLIVRLIPIIAAIVIGIFGLFQGWLTPNRVPSSSQNTSGNQSSNLIAGRDIINNIQYGVPQKVVDLLQQSPKENNPSISRNDLKLGEKIEKYKKLYSHLDRRSSNNSLLLEAKKKLTDADLEGTEKLLLESLDNNLITNNLKEASSDAIGISYLKELQLKPEQANESFQFSVKLANDANISANDRIPYNALPNAGINVNGNPEHYLFVLQNPDKLKDGKIEIENPDGKRYTISSHDIGHVEDHTYVKIPISGRVKMGCSEVYVAVNQGYSTEGPGQLIHDYGPYLVFRAFVDEDCKFRVLVHLDLASGGTDWRYEIRAFVNPKEYLKNIGIGEFETRRDWPQAQHESHIYILRVDRNRY